MMRKTYPEHFSNPSERNGGFTLIELMVVVAILGILTAIAYPSYQIYVLKSRRSDAYTALAQDQATMERCYAQSFSYSNCPAIPFGNSPQGYYAIAISNQSSTTYTLTATPLGSQVADAACASMGIDQASQKYANGNAIVPPSACWGQG